MRLCVHRAASQIGGNCIEITSAAGHRLLLDAGRPLDTPDNEATPVPASLDLAAPVSGVLVSHSHADHCGMLDAIPQNWPVYCSEAGALLIRLARQMGKQANDRQFRHYNDRQRLTLDSFAITPYLVDHSAFAAHAFRIDVDGKVVFYTGDFRTHGRKSALMDRLVGELQGKVDLLLQEGTNFRAPGYPYGGTISEQELEEQFAQAFKQCQGRVFISVAASNIDRLVTLFRACKNAERVLVVDLYTMLLLHKLKPFAKLPRAEWHSKNLVVAVTHAMCGLVDRLGDEGFPGGADAFIKYLVEQGCAMSSSRLADERKKWVIVMRDSFIGDFTHHKVVPDSNDLWIWSLWKGYLRNEKRKALLDYFAPCPRMDLHSSGHATPEALTEFARAINPRQIAVIHTEAKRDFSDILPQVRQIADGEWIDIP